MTQQLKRSEPLTVFAPTDDAFAKVPHAAPTPR